MTSFADFRPHFDGHWLNFCRWMLPRATRAETERLVWELAATTAQWLAGERQHLHDGDVLQIIVGWDESVLPPDEEGRQVGRQILKGGWKAAELPQDCHDSDFIARLQTQHPEWLRQGMLDAVNWQA